MMSVLARLSEMGLTLPQTPRPLAAYVPAVRTGDTVYVSGQLPVRDGALTCAGRLSPGSDLEAAREAARLCALNGLAAAASVVNLDDVLQVAKVTGFVASDPDFMDQPRVVNGASEFLQEVFGPAGSHARAAVGVAALPLGATVEVEMILTVKP